MGCATSRDARSSKPQLSLAKTFLTFEHYCRYEPQDFIPGCSRFRIELHTQRLRERPEQRAAKYLVVFGLHTVGDVFASEFLQVGPQFIDVVDPFDNRAQCIQKLPGLFFDTDLEKRTEGRLKFKQPAVKQLRKCDLKFRGRVKALPDQLYLPPIDSQVKRAVAESLKSCSILAQGVASVMNPAAPSRDAATPRPTAVRVRRSPRKCSKPAQSPQY